MASTFVEAGLVEWTDEQVKTEIANVTEVMQRLTEKKKNDEEVKALREQAKTLEEERYNQEIRLLKLQYKALRTQAKVRGIKFDLLAKEFLETSDK